MFWVGFGLLVVVVVGSVGFPGALVGSGFGFGFGGWFAVFVVGGAVRLLLLRRLVVVVVVGFGGRVVRARGWSRSGPESDLGGRGV